MELVECSRRVESSARRLLFRASSLRASGPPCWPCPRTAVRGRLPQQGPRTQARKFKCVGGSVHHTLHSPRAVLRRRDGPSKLQRSRSSPEQSAGTTGLSNDGATTVNGSVRWRIPPREDCCRHLTGRGVAVNGGDGPRGRARPSAGTASVVRHATDTLPRCGRAGVAQRRDPAAGRDEPLTTSRAVGYRRDACLTSEGRREKTAKNTGENARRRESDTIARTPLAPAFLCAVRRGRVSP
jgi:hypothetical protein